MLMNEDDILRFCQKIEKDEETGCWNWRGAMSGGYGMFRADGEPCLAHRVSMYLFKETPLRSESRKDGLILHKCNNKLCVNPRHLYEGTAADNVEDSRRAGTTYVRKSAFHEDISDMVLLNNIGYSLSDIATIYNCSKSNVSYLLRKERETLDEREECS